MKKTINKTESKKEPKIKILFLCTGNTCRSPMAEQIFKEFLRKKKLASKFDVKSAGLYADVGGGMAEFAIEAVSALGIKPKKHTPRQLNDRLAAATDIIICMTQNHKNRLDDKTRVKAVSFAEITGGYDLNDPYGLSRAQYDTAAGMLFFACEDILQLVLKMSPKTGLIC